MLTCVLPAENFKSKAVTVKLRSSKSKKRTKLLSVKEKSVESNKKQPLTDPKNEVSFFLNFLFLCSLVTIHVKYQEKNNIFFYM